MSENTQSFLEILQLYIQLTAAVDDIRYTVQIQNTKYRMMDTLGILGTELGTFCKFPTV